MMYASEFTLKHVELAFGHSLQPTGRKLTDVPVYEKL